MVGLSFDGLITGLNTEEIIQALVSVKRAPAQRLAARRDTESARLTAVQSLNASILGIQVAARALGDVDTFRAREAASTNSEVAVAVATSDAELGAFNISVQQLARAQQISSDPNNVFTDPDEALGIEGTIQVNGNNVEIRDTDTLRDVANRISNASGTVAASVIEVDDGQFRLSVRSIQTGSDTFSLTDVSGNDVLQQLRLTQAASFDTLRHPITEGASSNEFNVRVLPVGDLLNLDTNVPSGTVTIANGGGSFNVDIDLSTQSLDDIAQAINDAAGLAGNSTTATVVEVEQGVFRLDIETGDGTDPVLTDSGNVLETLGFVQPSFLQVDQAGEDARFTVNGIQVVRSTNNVSDVIQGVTLSLISDDDPGATTTVSVIEAEGEAASSIQSFVEAFNSTRNFIRQRASYNTETQQAGILLGDSSVLSTDSALTGLLSRRISTLPSQFLNTLNDGAGVAAGSIQITDRSGKTATIDLTEAETIQDVIDRIGVADIGVEARINRAGTGLTLVDTSGGFGTLTVEEVGGGTVASELGILGSRQSSTLQGSSIADPEFLSLTEIGISLNLDGTLSFNQSEFQAALSDNFQAVEAFFRQEGGFADQASQATERLTDSTNGVLTIRAEGIEQSIENFNDSIESIQERIANEEVRLRRQFTALEQSVSQLQSQGDYLQSQLSQLSSNQRRG
ncbi:MAG: flagellar filament capping protein FliD [Candidatus Omnitrophica bacterium]|nr:flagellar filament capping protein FliD [Candidatus Omnitrophota bacterium]